MTYKLKFLKDAAIIQKQEVEPFTGNALTVDLKTFEYSELQSMPGIIIEVNSITPEIVNGVLISLEMEFTTGKEMGVKPILTPAQSKIEQKVPSIKIAKNENEILFEDLISPIQNLRIFQPIY